MRIAISIVSFLFAVGVFAVAVWLLYIFCTKVMGQRKYTRIMYNDAERMYRVDVMQAPYPWLYRKWKWKAEHSNAHRSYAFEYANRRQREIATEVTDAKTRINKWKRVR